jgi:hypothetical protein
MTGTGKINLFSQIPASARFNTFLRIRKDFFSPLSSCRSPLLLRHTQPRRHAFERFGPAGRCLSLATHWANSLPSHLLPISCQTPLVDIVLYRGLTMQHAVAHDEQGLSNYTMCAVNPSRVGETFDDAALREIVITISNGTLPRKNVPRQ